MRRHRPRAPIVALALLIVLPAPRAAGAATIFENIRTLSALDLDPSARSAAMGGAGGAVFWGGDADAWANPALLGAASGIAYRDGVARLLPGVVDDVRFHGHQTTLGWGGIGVGLAGRPFDGLGKLELDYGLPRVPPGTAPLANAYERVRSWGVGASLAGVARTVAALRGGEPPGIARYADLGFGIASKHLERSILPAYGFGVGSAATRDWGLIARARAPWPAGGVRGMPFAIEAAYGYSVLEAGDDHITYADGSTQVLRRHHRNAAAARATLGMPASWKRRLPAWLAPGLEPLLSLGGACDREHLRAAGGSGDYGHIDHAGGELAIANLLAVSIGRLGESGNPAVTTWGIGAGLPFGRCGGARYQHANVARPPEFGEPDLTQDVWTLWLDPVAILRARP